MPKKETDSWTRGNTLKMSYAAKVINIKQSNLNRLNTDGRLRKVKVHFEKFYRIPLIDCLMLIADEHTAISKRMKEIEEYTSHLGKIYTFYEYQKDKKEVQEMDISDETIEILKKIKRNSGISEYQEFMV